MNCRFVSDIAKKNDVIVLPISPALRLSAVVWTEEADESLKASRFNCLSKAIERITALHPNWDLWFLAAHDTIQPDNRITRYHGLCKSLVTNDTQLPKGEFTAESTIVVEGGMQVFGAIKFKRDQLDKVFSLIPETQGAIAFASESAGASKIPLLVQRGWTDRNTNPPEEIVELLCDQSGFVIGIYGQFDDPEAAVAIIGKKEALSSLIAED